MPDWSDSLRRILPGPRYREEARVPVDAEERATDQGSMDAGQEDRLFVEMRAVPRSDTVVLVMTGEVDHDTIGHLTEALQEETGAVRIIADCSELRFCDSTGLNVLLKARQRALRHGGRLDLAGLRPPVERMFTITGAHSLFRVYPDVEAALGDGQPDA
jgi:stage II sporulation protein AA (anti-sigma F factor antagonist)